MKNLFYILNVLKKIFLKITGLFLILLLSFCQEPYDPENLDNDKNILVVHGGISNEPAPYHVTLFYARDINEGYGEAIGGASVLMRDDLGNQELFMEDSAGYYSTDSLGMQGVPGRKYHLEIILADGSEYKSIPEIMKPPVELSSFYAEIEQRDFIEKDINGNPEINTRNGIQVYLDLHLQSGETEYFKFTNVVIWQTSFQRDIGSLYPIFIDVYKRILHNPDDVPNIKFTLDENGQQVIKKQPIVFLPFKHNYKPCDKCTKFINNGWIVSVNTSRIGKEAYIHFDGIKKQLVSEDRIFDPIPSFIPGNIKSVKDSSEVVLGQFLVSSGKRENKFFFWDEGFLHVESKNINDPGIFETEEVDYTPFEYWIERDPVK